MFLPTAQHPFNHPGVIAGVSIAASLPCHCIISSVGTTLLFMASAPQLSPASSKITASTRVTASIMVLVRILVSTSLLPLVSQLHCDKTPYPQNMKTLQKIVHKWLKTSEACSHPINLEALFSRPIHLNDPFTQMTHSLK